MTYLKKNLTYKKNELETWVAYYGDYIIGTDKRKADCEAKAKKWVEEMNAKAEAEAEPEVEIEPEIEEVEKTAEPVEEYEEPYNLNHKLAEVLDALKNGEELKIMTADIIFSCRMTDNGMFSIKELSSGETKVVKFPKFYGIAIRDAFGLPTNKAHVRVRTA